MRCITAWHDLSGKDFAGSDTFVERRLIKWHGGECYRLSPTRDSREHL